MNDDLLQALLILWLALEWALRLAALFVVPRNRRPNAGLSWLLFIFLIPWVGWVVFAVLGSSKLPRNRRDIQTSLDQYFARVMKQISGDKQLSEKLLATSTKKYQSSVALSQSLTHLPLFAGNSLEPIDDYADSISRLVDDINAARQYVYIEYYILALDSATEPLFEALAEAVKRGVKARVLYDDFGSRKFKNRKEMNRRLKSIGAEYHAMLPLNWPGKKYTRPDLRNHRKLAVIDGMVGYTGSLNLVQSNYHRKDDIYYDEMVVRAEGPVVAQLEAVFMSDWMAESGKIPEVENEPEIDSSRLVGRGASDAHVVPSGPGYDDENNRKFFASLFYAAEKEITIVNPYFVPDESLITAIISAAKRGVTVKLINSEATDQVMVAHAQRSYYEQMLKAGVEIYLYKKPVLLHSKFTIIDDDACFVGSSNMDIRSFELNQELTLATYDKQFVARMKQITEGYIEKSNRVDQDKWSKRPPRKQLLDNIARLTSSLQ